MTNGHSPSRSETFSIQKIAGSTLTTKETALRSTRIAIACGKGRGGEPRQSGQLIRPGIMDFLGVLLGTIWTAENELGRKQLEYMARTAL